MILHVLCVITNPCQQSLHCPRESPISKFCLGLRVNNFIRIVCIISYLIMLSRCCGFSCCTKLPYCSLTLLPLPCPLLSQWKQFLLADAVAGVTVGMLAVPQGMSYATVAGLSPVYGLYNSFYPMLICTLHIFVHLSLYCQRPCMRRGRATPEPGTSSIRVASRAPAAPSARYIGYYMTFSLF